MNRDRLLILEEVTVGLPFSAFKALTGLVLLGHPAWSVLGDLLIALGAIDGAINLVNLGSTLLGRGRVLGVCLSQITLVRLGGRRPGWDDLGISVDVMLSFVLVAAMIAFDLLPQLPTRAMQVWSVSVVLNVLGAGFGRLSTSLKQLRAAGAGPGPRAEPSDPA